MHTACYVVTGILRILIVRYSVWWIW